MRHQCSGFTLIELLVVIAIIAILAAILFPVILAAKAMAIQSSCQSNIKQLGVAMSLYAEANDNRLPEYDKGTGDDRLMWWDFIYPYLKTGKIYRCPALLDSRGASTIYGPHNRVYGYGVATPHLFSSNGVPPKLSQVKRPTKVMMICDSYTYDYDVNHELVVAGMPCVYCRCTKGPTGHSWNYGLVYRPDGNVAGRHDGRTVVLYVDEHVRAWKKEYVTHEYDSVADSGNNDMWGHFDNIR
jgi:prepilin-type N-terminal cleavage/methylation domain-containing protein